MNIVLYDDYETLDAFGSAEVFGKLPEAFHLRYFSVPGGLINSTQGRIIVSSESGRYVYRC